MGKEVRKPNLSPWFTWAPRGSTVSLPLHCDCPWETQPWRQDGERWTWAIIGNLLQGLGVGKGTAGGQPPLGLSGKQLPELLIARLDALNPYVGTGWGARILGISLQHTELLDCDCPSPLHLQLVLMAAYLRMVGISELTFGMCFQARTGQIVHCPVSFHPGNGALLVGQCLDTPHLCGIQSHHAHFPHGAKYTDRYSGWKFEAGSLATVQWFRIQIQDKGEEWR